MFHKAVHDADLRSRIERPARVPSQSFCVCYGCEKDNRIAADLEATLGPRPGAQILHFNTLAPGELLDVRRMPAWIRGIVWLSGRDIQRDTIQLMRDSGYVDGYRHLHPDDKGYTFPVWDPHLRLDYVFVPGGFANRLLDCKVIREPKIAPKASDHFPLLAQLQLD